MSRYRRLRTVDTADGPAVLVPTGGEALALAVAIRRAVESSPLPSDSAVVRHLRAFGTELVRAESHRERGIGFSVETDSPCRSPRWITPREMAQRTGLSAQAVTKRLRLGQVPGAEMVNGRWQIPVDPDDEDSNHEHAA